MISPDNTRSILIAALARPAGPSSDYDLNPDQPIVRPKILRPAAVLIGVLPTATGPRVLLTKRASHLKHHPGQIAFPGGKQDASDASPQATALREAQEEVGLDPALVEILGVLPTHQTVTGFQVIPVLGWIKSAFDAKAEAGEVEEVFTVPLSHLANPANYRIESRFWQGQPRRYYCAPYGPYYIWGATARMLRALADRLQP